MTSTITGALLAALLLGSVGPAKAYAPVNPFTTPGVPGTGYSATIMGPCYCDQTAVFSPVVLLAPGTYDLGTVRNFWVPANFTPDGGPDQPVLWLLFMPWEAVGTWEYLFPQPPTYSDPITEVCALNDAACNARYDGTFVETRLITTVGPGQDAVELGLIGPFTYAPPSPLPEPLPCALFIIGLALTAGASRRRLRRSVRRSLPSTAQ